MSLKIKDEYKNHIVGFNNSGKPLGERSDLNVLAEVAIKSGNKDLLKLFEKIPTLEELKAEKEEKFLDKTKDQVVVVPKV